MMLHLWEVKHDYYCTLASTHHCLPSWRAFIDGYSPFMDANFLVRWDWHEVPEDARDELRLYVLLQRVGGYVSFVIWVEKSDEVEIRAWLEERARYMQAMWSPLLPPVLSRDEARELRNQMVRALDGYHRQDPVVAPEGDLGTLLAALEEGRGHEIDGLDLSTVAALVAARDGQAGHEPLVVLCGADGRLRGLFLVLAPEGAGGFDGKL